MKKATAFLAGNTGRAIRTVAGLGLVLVAALALSGPALWVMAGVGFVVYLEALFDVCLLGLLTHKSLRDASIRPKASHREVTVTSASILAIGLVAAALFAILVNQKMSNAPTNISKSNDQAVTTTVPPSQTSDAAVAANKTSQNDLLLYLIEEEKLAHDVYTVMYQTYGARVFGNILNSEQTHQSRVLALLEARGIADPRSTELGEFTNPELQSLYDQLIAQGKQSAEEAYKVGVAIEEKDIADITKQLATATDNDVVSTLEALRMGSENHLRAFNRQLGKY